MLKSILWIIKYYTIYSYIKISGVRLYPIDFVLPLEETTFAKMKTIGSYEIHFTFYLQKCHYSQLLLNNNIKKINCWNFIISAKYPDNIPNKLKEYNDIRLFAQSSHNLLIKSKIVPLVLLDIYLEFIKHQLEHKK